MNFESVHNHYEQLVFEEILAKQHTYKLPDDANVLEDVACVALNLLPARYIRYDIDFAFYLTQEERTKLEISVRDAVRSAADYVLTYSARYRNDNPAA